MFEHKHPLKVFLCHATADKPKVRELYSYLKKRGIQPWLDAIDLLPGQNWQTEIPKALETSDTIIICLSKGSVDKEGYVQKEIKFALDKALEMPEGRIFIIPARLDECDLPRSLSAYHWVDLFGEDGYEKLMKSLKHRAAQLQRATISPEIAELKEPKKPHRKWKSEYIIAIIGAAAIIIAALIGILPQIIKLVSTTTATMMTPTNISESKTPKPNFTSTKTFSTMIASTPLPKVYDPYPVVDDYYDAFGIPMRLVLAGEFTMGSNTGQPNERPAHIVNLPAFYIDKYEVTNSLYKACVNTGVCKPPNADLPYTRSDYYANSQFGNYPVSYATWYMAKAYCEWRGVRLPTEAEWEKAARGTDARTYPWGEGIDNTFANYNSNVGDTTQVGAYEKGKSLYGLYDMAGNVWEWVADWYAAYPGGNLQADSNFGQTYRILRGGSWGVKYDGNLMMFARYGVAPDDIWADYGFRCARSAP